ncbi:GNAT family N-acetyltransferase [Williamsia sterculiae]|uniref:N-acetyltransferase domain-containing protein n=1 Tax=Williamsia sterculiae TaxID=1344003 RepID=A0A1N7CDX7_9NOCA|nr:GNAT family N-acetyltransferase [Williamsia sterculiae]SIR61789.1 hypothetical protein SAMN05445060_0065 [Williamsia sterculiae]
MNDETVDVRDRPEEQRYVLTTIESRAAVIGEEIYTDLTPAAGRAQRVLIHTGVDDAYGGRGLASVLVQRVLDDVIDQGRDIVPICPYVVRWLSRHPEYADHVIEPTEEHRRAAKARRQQS